MVDLYGTVLDLRLKLSQAQSDLMQVTEAIRYVVTQQADDVCWMDAYVKLGKFVGVDVTLESLKLLPKAVMMKNCDHFVDCLQLGVPYKAPEIEHEVERYSS